MYIYIYTYAYIYIYIGMSTHIEIQRNVYLYNSISFSRQPRIARVFLSVTEVFFGKSIHFLGCAGRSAMSFALLRLLTSKVVYHAVEQDQNILNQFIATLVRPPFGTYFGNFTASGAWGMYLDIPDGRDMMTHFSPNSVATLKVFLR